MEAQIHKEWREAHIHGPFVANPSPLGFVPQFWRRERRNPNGIRRTTWNQIFPWRKWIFVETLSPLGLLLPHPLRKSPSFAVHFNPFRILNLIYFILIFSQSFIHFKYLICLGFYFRFLGTYLDGIMAKEEGCFLDTTQEYFGNYLRDYISDFQRMNQDIFQPLYMMDFRQK